MNLLVLIIPILITNLFIILVLKNNKSLDHKMIVMLLFKYSVIILFAIVEYIYLIRHDINYTKIITSILFNSLGSYLFGNTVLKISELNELNDEELLKLSRTSMINMICLVSLILVFVL